MSYSTPPPPGPTGGAYGGGYAQPRTNQKATWALVTGILGMVCCGLVAGVPALILGIIAKKEIAASGGAQSGSGMAQAGIILGVISIVLSLLYFGLIVAGALTFPTTSFSTSP